MELPISNLNDKYDHISSLILDQCSMKGGLYFYCTMSSVELVSNIHMWNMLIHNYDSDSYTLESRLPKPVMSNTLEIRFEN